MAKLYAGWLFDLDEHLSERGSKMRSSSFDRRALDLGYAENMTPEAFLSHPCSLREQVLEPVRVAGPKDRSLRISNSFIAGAVAVVVLLVAVPQILRSRHHHSGRHLAAAQRALSVVERLSAMAKPGAEIEAYAAQVGRADAEVDKLEGEFGADPFQTKLAETVAHFEFGRKLWVATADEPNATRGLPEVETLWQKYPDSHVWFMGDTLLSSTPGLNVVWAEARKGIESAKEQL